MNAVPLTGRALLAHVLARKPIRVVSEKHGDEYRFQVRQSSTPGVMFVSVQRAGRWAFIGTLFTKPDPEYRHARKSIIEETEFVSLLASFVFSRIPQLLPLHYYTVYEN